MNDYNNGTPDNKAIQQGYVIANTTPQSFAVSGDMQPDEPDVALKNNKPIMDKQQEERNAEYNALIKEVTPTHNLWLQMIKAL